jgi:muramidase (phage lysozyme)
LQRIADHYGRDVTVTSGDRNSVPRGGSRTSLHLAHRAADFHVNGLADARVFQNLKENISAIFERTEGYEFIHHGRYTETMGEHLHIGHYSGRNVGTVIFKTEGLTQATSGDYALDPRAIGNGAPATRTRPPATNNTPSQLRAAVGRGGANLKNDVETVQRLLNRARRRLRRAYPNATLWRPLAEDGICGSRTMAAIVAFQRQVMRFRTPDGRIDPRGRTLRMLQAINRGDAVTLPTRIRQEQQNPSNNGGQRTAQDLVNDPHVRAMLDTLIYSEGTGAGYGTIVRGTVISAPYNPELVGQRNVVITDFSRHPEILVQVRPGLRSTAAGRYQFILRTWRGLGLADFTPASQDLGAVMLMRQRNMITPLLNGNFRQAVHNGAPEWASLPTAQGGSHYPGQHARSIESLERVYNEALARYQR